MRHVRPLAAAIAVSAVASFAAGCEETIKTPSEPAVVITLDIAPSVVPSLTVGQTVQLIAIVSGTPTQTATWTSSNSGVASVNAVTGVVTCLSQGVAVITAVSTVDATARDATVVTCVPAVAANLIQVAPTSLAFTHRIGTDGCPQAIGSVVVNNTSGVSVTVTIALPGTLLANATSFSLAPGEGRTVAISFNCSTQQSFAANVTITATTTLGASDPKTVQVTGTITN